MQRARLSDGVARHVEMGRYHYRMLNTRTATQALAEQFRLVQQPLEQSLTAYLEIRFERSIVYGRLMALDAEWDEAISGFNRKLLVLVNGNHDATLYRSCFPTGRIVETTRAQFSNAPIVAAQFAEVAQTHPESITQEMLQPISAIAQQISTALTSLAEQDALVSKIRTAITVAHIPWIKTYNDNYSHLRLLFPEKPGLVESFFMRERKKAENEADNESEPIA